MRELKVKKCRKCGAMIKIINDCNCDNCGIKCCNEAMTVVKANSVDAAIEKHVPSYDVKDNKLIVKVNHVMDDDHYIEWICLLTETKEEFIYLKPGEKAEVAFEHVDSGIIYSYCNKHGLWKQEIN